jgi:pyruvate carboxylase
VAKRPPPRKVEPGNLKHVGAPMPGTIGTVAARAGVKLARGDVLLTLEAMKMETTVRSEQDGTVQEVLAKPGMSVDAKDLLVVFE